MGKVFVPCCLLLLCEKGSGRGMKSRFVGALQALLVCAIPYTCLSIVCSCALPGVSPGFPRGPGNLSSVLLPSTSMIIWALMRTEDYKAVIYGHATKVPIIG